MFHEFLLAMWKRALEKVRQEENVGGVRRKGASEERRKGASVGCVGLQGVSKTSAGGVSKRVCRKRAS